MKKSNKSFGFHARIIIISFFITFFLGSILVASTSFYSKKQRYTDTENHFSFELPSGWIVEENGYLGKPNLFICSPGFTHNQKCTYQDVPLHFPRYFGPFFIFFVSSEDVNECKYHLGTLPPESTYDLKEVCLMINTDLTLTEDEKAGLQLILSSFQTE